MNKRERLEDELKALEKRKEEIRDELKNMCLLEDLVAGTFFKEAWGKGTVFQKVEPTKNLARMMLPEMPMSCGVSLVRYLDSNLIGYRLDTTEVIVVPAPDEEVKIVIESKEKLLLRSILSTLIKINEAGNLYHDMWCVKVQIEKFLNEE